jgi:AcrR family transcriptional regulator
VNDPAQRPMRADARRNYGRILAAAREAFAAHGAEASLDDIARAAGVGNATLYRHFPARAALLDAVFRERVEALCAEADALIAQASAQPPPLAPDDALEAWLRALIVHVTAYRGLATWLMSAPNWAEGGLASCQASIRTAGTALLTLAQRSGVVRGDVSATRLLRLANAIALVSEQAAEEGEGTDEADGMLSLVMDGLRTAPRPR